MNRKQRREIKTADTKQCKQSVRLQISKAGFDMEYLTIKEITNDEVLSLIATLINTRPLTSSNRGHKTLAVVRSAYGSENVEIKCISFRGFNPKEVKIMTENYLQKINQQ